MENFGLLKLVEIIESKISNGTYDYLLDWSNPEYSIIHVVENEKDVDFELKGWHIWIIKHPNEYSMCNGVDTIFIQTANGDWGYDHHVLTENEINNLVIFFIKGNYKINKIK